MSLLKSGKIENLDGIRAAWIQVRVGKVKGWIFGGYASRFKFPRGCKSLRRYAQGAFRAASPPRKKSWESCGRSQVGKTCILYEQRFRNGVYYKEVSFYEGGGESLFLPGASLYEAFVIGSQCSSELRDAAFKPEKGNKIDIQSAPHGGGEYLNIRLKDGGALIDLSTSA